MRKKNGSYQRSLAIQRAFPISFGPLKADNRHRDLNLSGFSRNMTRKDDFEESAFNCISNITLHHDALYRVFETQIKETTFEICSAFKRIANHLS